MSCAAFVSASAPAAVANQVQIFQFTGSEQVFRVPAGVTSIHVIAYGARGGAGNAGTSFGAGTPARAEATLQVQPGQPLYLEVGGRGQNSNASSQPCSSNTCRIAVGGFNGGGSSVSGAVTSAGTPNSGGGGGGASDLRSISTSAQNSLASRLIVAAGAGGDGGAEVPSGTAGGQGASAGAVGGNGGAPYGHNLGGGGGLPGQDAAAGQGGGAGGAGQGGSVYPGQAGGPGLFISSKQIAQGGVGGGQIETSGAPFTAGGSGGGGGGGLYGGGGGGGGGFQTGPPDDAGSGGGGAGGSSYAPGGQLTLQSGASPDGLVQISWVGAAPPPESDASKERQAQASEEFRAAAREALAPCGRIAGQAALNVIELSTIAGEVAELSLAALAPAVKAALGLDVGGVEQGQECAAAIKKMADAYTKYKADPPNPAVTTISLPAATKTAASRACSHKRGKVRKVCDRIVGAGLRVRTAENRVTAIDDAIATTIDRLSTATTKHSSLGIARQSAVLAALNDELAAALSIENTADRALSRQFKRAHVKVTIPRATVARAAQLIRSRSSTLGIPGDQLTALLGVDFGTAAVDYGDSLSAAVPTAVPRKIARTITLPGLRVLLDALGHRLLHKAETTLSGELKSAVRARFAAARRRALRRFSGAAGRAGGPVGELLAAGAHALGR